MAGVYVHIPFCKQACSYCDFHFSTSLKLTEEMITAICREAALQHTFWDTSTSVTSIYFGGGTPSIISPISLDRIMQTLYKIYSISEDAEITLEANPDDMTAEKLSQWRQIGINRLSIGVQSFYEKELEWMNRTHTAEQAKACIINAQNEGFNNLTIDLIFGTPYTDDTAWTKQLETLIEIQIPHLAIYALTIEERTALAHWVAKGKHPVATDTRYRNQFLLTHELLTEKGYDHYELSNYAIPGFYARHNSEYWSDAMYLGLGPSAHSYNGISRMANVANNAQYLSKIRQGVSAYVFEEKLTLQERYHDYLLTHLRHKKGVSTSFIRSAFQIDWENAYTQKLKGWLQKGYMKHIGDVYILTPQGWLISDSIIQDLFLDTVST